NYLLKSIIDATDRKITLVYAGESLYEKQKSTIIDKSLEFGILDAKIEVQQGLSFGNSDEKISELVLLKEELNRISQELTGRDKYSDSLKANRDLGKKLLNELSPIYPEITQCVYAESQSFAKDSSATEPLMLLVFTSNKRLSKTTEEKIRQWAVTRLGSQHRIKVLYELQK